MESDKSVEIIEYYRNNWTDYIEDACGLRTWSGMRLIIDSVQNNKRTSVRAAHGISKCREENELIQLSDGSIVKIKELINKSFEIETPQGFKKAYAADNGIQKIKVLKLGNGTEIKITDNHPLYVAEKSGKKNIYGKNRKEYLEVKGFTNDIKQGSCIAAPVKTNSKINYNNAMNIMEIKLLAYIIADGSTRGGAVTMTTEDELIKKDVYEIAEYYNIGIRKTGKYDYHFTGGNKGGRVNPVKKVIRQYGIDNKLAKDKDIPSQIFQQSDKKICEFLKYLYMCDGHVICKNSSTNRITTQIGYTTVSRKLAEDVYILLKRIGIKRPLIHTQKTQWTYKGIKKEGICHKIFIASLEDAQVFSRKIKLWSYKGERLQQLLEVERTGAKRPYGKWRQDCLPNMYWEDVKSVRYEEAKTVAITVPETGTYITPYAYEHNTLTGSAIAVTFLNLYWPSIIITTAPTNNQVKNLLWKEIGSIYRKNTDLRGKCNLQEIRIDPDWYMLGFSTDKPYRMEGFHDANILWILDEAKGLEQWLFDAVEGSMTGGQARILELSTTDGADQQCSFRKHHSQERSAWNCIKFSAYDSPFVNPSKFPREKKYMNQDLFKYGRPKNKSEWPKKLQPEIQITNEPDIKEKRKMWEIKRPDLWETKVLGEFAKESEYNLIPLAWVESAINAVVDAGDGATRYGFDVARMGNDQCVLTKMTGKTVEFQDTWGKKKLSWSVGKLMAETKLSDIINVDACGVGAGVFDDLAEQGHAAVGLDSAASAFDTKTYKNLRAEMWFNARAIFEEQYENGNVISIPDDDELIEDLTGIRYKPLPNGQYLMENKEEYKKRLGRSPDKGDSFVYNVYIPPLYAEEYYGEADDDTDIFL